MGLFNKKKKEKSQELKEGELPPIPSLPPLPSTQESPNLPPDLPPLPTQENSIPKIPEVSSAQVREKQTTKTPPHLTPKVKEIGVPRGYTPSTFSERTAMQPLEVRVPGKKQIPPKTEHKIITEYRKEAEPFFVRIDKFEEALKNLDLIKEKINDMESFLAQIRDKRAEEDEQLNAWEEEIERIKEKINKIDKNIFSKLEESY